MSKPSRNGIRPREKKFSVLVIDDDPNIITLLENYISKIEDYMLVLLSAHDGETGFQLARQKHPDLIVLDVNMPHINGLQVCRMLKECPDTRDIPIVFLSGRSDEVDRILGLEFGGDDYITKPFSPREFYLRVQNVLRRVYSTDDSETIFRAGVLSVDLARHEVMVRDQPVSLTLTEFKLLACLMEKKGQVRSRDYLLEHIWDHGEGVYSRTVDTHIQRLRTKLKDAGACIETVRGIGYRLISEPAEK